MKNPIALKSILALALGVFLTQSPALAGPAVHGTGDVCLAVPDLAPDASPPMMCGDDVVKATAKILRNDKGVTINIRTVGLNPHNAYTVWVFDLSCPGTPRECGMFLTGHIVGGSGKATFSGRLGLNNPSLVNPFGEIHATIVDHGPLDPSSLPDSIKTPLPPHFWAQIVKFIP